MKIDIGHNFLRINCCLRRDRHQQQVDSALFQLIMKVDNRRNRISRFGFMCPADFRRVSAPELADREKSNIAGKKKPAIHARDHCRVFAFSRA